MRNFCLLVIITTFFCTIFLNATNQVTSNYSVETKKGELRADITTNMLGYIGTFLAQKELFSLVRLHKNAQKRHHLLILSGKDQALRFEQQQEDFAIHRTKRIEIEKELQKKESLFCIKNTCLTCLYGPKLGMKIALWTTIATAATAAELARITCLLTATCSSGVLSCIVCDGNIKKETLWCFKECYQCLYCGQKKPQCCCSNCLTNNFWHTTKPYEHDLKNDQQYLDYLKQKIISTPWKVFPQSEEMQRD